MNRTAVVALALLLAAAGGCRRESKSPVPSTPNAANRVAMRPVSLFYESPRMLLAAESRSVALPESPAAAVPVVLRELLKGPGVAASTRLFPADTILRGAYMLPGGTVVVDLGGPTIAAGWSTGSHQELMAVHSIVQTVTTNFPEVRRVRLVVNGSPNETLAGHLSLTRSFAPLPDLSEPAAR